MRAVRKINTGVCQVAKFMTMPLNARQWVRRGSDFESKWPSERQFLEKQRREVWRWPDAFCP
jgi:hypothetical protein